MSLGARCTLSGHVPGTAEVLAFDYVDADGDVRGGVFENTTSAPVGGPMTFTPRIPSTGITISETTSGTVSVTACLHFGVNSSITEQVKVTDASGKVSNTLTIDVPRAAGLPLLPHDGDTAPRKSLEFQR